MSYYIRVKYSSPYNENNVHVLDCLFTLHLFICNNKKETEQTRLTEKLNQLQVRVQFLKHNMKGDDIKKEFEY